MYVSIKEYSYFDLMCAYARVYICVYDYGNAACTLVKKGILLHMMHVCMYVCMYVCILCKVVTQNSLST